MNTHRFVVVDDDPFALMLLEGVLKAGFPDCAITEFRRSKEALAHILDDPPDAVLTDYKLGDMDGAELTTRLRSRGMELPVIMVSNHPCANEMADAAGATAFIEKLR